MRLSVSGAKPPKNGLPNPRGLLPEQQVVAPSKLCLPVRLAVMSGKEPESSRGFGREKIAPRRVLDAIDEVPVVETSAAARLFIHIESDGVHDVQSAAKRRGRSTDVPSVVGDFGFEEDQVQNWRGECHAGIRFASAFESTARTCLDFLDLRPPQLAILRTHFCRCSSAGLERWIHNPEVGGSSPPIGMSGLQVWLRLIPPVYL